MSTRSGSSRSKEYSRSSSIGIGPRSWGTSKRLWCKTTASWRWAIREFFSMLASKTRAWLSAILCLD